MRPIDADTLSAIPLDQAIRYLAATGWLEVDGYARIAIWVRRFDDAEAEVLLPTSSQVRDYPARMAELISTVAKVEQRDSADVLYSLLFPGTDVQHVRLIPETPSGTAPLRDGYRAFRGVHDLFLSAATSAVLSRALPQLPSQKPERAWQFVDRVRLGPTGAGSYVIRVETPVAADRPDAVDPRDVLRQLYRAVESARAAADDDRRAFRDAMEQGVSANLCEALVNIGGGDHNNPFEVTFDWDVGSPVTFPTPIIAFSPAHIVGLKNGGKYLRELTPTQPATATGRIVELRRQGRRQGQVVVTGQVSVEGYAPTYRPVLVPLDAHRYDIAMRAHGDELVVTVTGDLTTIGKTWEFQAVNTFDVVAPGQQPEDRR